MCAAARCGSRTQRPKRGWGPNPAHPLHRQAAQHRQDHPHHLQAGPALGLHIGQGQPRSSPSPAAPAPHAEAGARAPDTRGAIHGVVCQDAILSRPTAAGDHRQLRVARLEVALVVPGKLRQPDVVQPVVGPPQAGRDRCDEQPGVWRVGAGVWQREADAGAAGPADPASPHRDDQRRVFSLAVAQGTGLLRAWVALDTTGQRPLSGSASER